jgi:hypothetical protein
MRIGWVEWLNMGLLLKLEVWVWLITLTLRLGIRAARLVPPAPPWSKDLAGNSLKLRLQIDQTKIKLVFGHDVRGYTHKYFLLVSFFLYTVTSKIEVFFTLVYAVEFGRSICFWVWILDRHYYRRDELGFILFYFSSSLKMKN